MLILSGDICLNAGPVYNNQSLDSNEWNVFRSKGIHLIHLNIHSLLPKTDEICYIAEQTKAAYIAEQTKAAVIGITESKFDKAIFQSEIHIDLIHFDVIETETLE